MKYLVISDIHGAAHGMELLLEAKEKHNTDAVLCLGDILYHGPRNDVPEDYNPKSVIEQINPLSDSIIAVRGNCEAEVDQMVLQFPCMSDLNVLFCGSRKICMSHGHVYSPDNLPAMRKGDVFLSGHTHIPTAYEADGIYLCNPGSASLPKGGHPCSYGILDETGFTVYTAEHVPYMEIDFQ
ncbi:MAG: phosphodiesterase [Bulleidia sp.]